MQREQCLGFGFARTASGLSSLAFNLTNATGTLQPALLMVCASRHAACAEPLNVSSRFEAVCITGRFFGFGDLRLAFQVLLVRTVLSLLPRGHDALQAPVIDSLEAQAIVFCAALIAIDPRLATGSFSSDKLTIWFGADLAYSFVIVVFVSTRRYLRSDLEGIKEEAGGAVIDARGGDSVDDLAEHNLDRSGVFKGRNLHRLSREALLGMGYAMEFCMEVAKRAIAQGW